MRKGVREGKQLCHVHSACSSPDYAMLYYME